MTRARQWRCRG